MLKFIIDDNIPFIKGTLEPFGQVKYLMGSHITRTDIIDADALLVRTRTACNSKLLQGTKVSFIGSATIGTDHIDTGWCQSHGIKCVNAPGSNSVSVMQYIAAVLIFLINRKGICAGDLTMGIVGAGNTGSKVAQMAKILGLKVLLNDPPREEAEGKELFSTLEEITEVADIISFHVPLTLTGRHSTIGLASGKMFKKMKEGTIIINSSRGQVVDEDALAQALRSGKAGGAALDVWTGEPVINRELLSLADITTPHIAGYSTEGKSNATRIIVNELATFFGLPLGEWKPEEPCPPADNLIDETILYGSVTEQLAAAILHTCPVDKDSRLLKDDPGRFEELRSACVKRREFGAYSVSTGNNEVRRILAGLGFRIIE